MRNLFACACLLCAFSVQAQTCWEYKIVDTEVEPTNKQLKAKASQRKNASPSLVGVLNDLGADGWELAGNNQIRIFENRPDIDAASNKNSSWTASLNPEVALFRRAIACQ